MHHFNWSGVIGLAADAVDRRDHHAARSRCSRIVVGIVWGTVLALMRLSRHQAARVVREGIYVTLFRSIPLVMVLLWFFLIVPQFLQNVLGLSPDIDIRLASAMVAFSLFEAAYYSEIIRAGIQSVRAGR